MEEWSMIGKKLRELRKERGWTQAILADRLHMHHSSICYWEKDLSEPPLEMVRKLALLFGVSADYLLDLPPRSAAAGGQTENTDTAEEQRPSAMSGADGESRLPASEEA